MVMIGCGHYLILGVEFLGILLMDHLLIDVELVFLKDVALLIGKVPGVSSVVSVEHGVRDSKAKFGWGGAYFRPQIVEKPLHFRGNVIHF